MTRIPCTNPNSGVRFHRSHYSYVACCRRMDPSKMTTDPALAVPPSLLKSLDDGNPKENVERTYLADGSLSSEVWFSDDEVHREDGPARREWDENGQLVTERWCLNGEYHREDGPALTNWDGHGQIEYEEYWRNGERHREDGPASTRWFNGRIGYQMFWLDNEEYPGPEYWTKAVPRYKQSHPEFADMPDEWVEEYLKGQLD